MVDYQHIRILGVSLGLEDLLYRTNRLIGIEGNENPKTSPPSGQIELWE